MSYYPMKCPTRHLQNYNLQNYISFIYKQILINEGLKCLGRVVLDDKLSKLDLR